MTRSNHISRAWLAAFCASVVLFSSVWTLTRRVRPITWAADPELTVLVSDHERLRDNSDLVRDGLRKEWEARRDLVWTVRSLEDLCHRLGSVWRSVALPPEGAARRYRFTALSSEMRSWSTLLESIVNLERMPGVAVESLDIAADGAFGPREFTRVEIVVRFAAANSDERRAEFLEQPSRVNTSAAGVASKPSR